MVNIYGPDRRTRSNDEIYDFRGGQGVRCLGMLGRTTVGKAGGDGGLGWADCWRWRRPFPVLLPRFRVPRPIRKRSVSTMTCCRTTTASSALLATTAIASLSKWDYASPSSSTLWVEPHLLSRIPKHYPRPVWMALETIESTARCVCVCVCVCVDKSWVGFPLASHRFHPAEEGNCTSILSSSCLVAIIY